MVNDVAVGSGTWWISALLSAFFAALATAIRTAVVLAFAWGITFAKGEHHALGALSRKTILFLGLSGIATGLSWLAYFRALQLGPASRVAPVDKLSLALTLLLAAVVLHEPLTWRVAAGVALMVAGALLTLE